MLPVLLDRQWALREHIASRRNRSSGGLHAFACELLELRAEIAAILMVLRTDREQAARRRTSIMRA